MATILFNHLSPLTDIIESATIHGLLDKNKGKTTTQLQIRFE
jgi:hypothetical protein